MNENLDYSQEGLALTAASESMRLTSYPDPGTGAEPWTIGVGHTGPDVHPGMRITTAQGYSLLRADIQIAVHAVRQMVRVPLTQGQFDGLVDWVFNIGQGAAQESTLLRLLNAGDYTGAASHFSEWNRAGGKVMAGLVTRRKNDTNIFLGIK